MCPPPCLLPSTHNHPPSHSHSMNLAEIELEAGKTNPFPEGFDPLGLATGKSFKELKKFREAELKHGKLGGRKG